MPWALGVCVSYGGAAGRKMTAVLQSVKRKNIINNTNKKTEMRKKIKDKIALAAVLLALTMPCTCAYRQGNGTDGFFNNGVGFRDGDDDYNGVSWGNFNNTSPEADLGGGLALLTVAGFGYACAKRRKMKKQELH